MAENNFETSILRLEEIVRELERGDAPLDKSLALFEEGARLLRSAGMLLDAAEQKVTLLQKGADGEPEETEFDPGE
ncbi:MAG: exodeoxyribonuclease VII small subunit [Oscillospiraceae bacterium]|jgi:exodeoxyribonuclease VII small subunit|nr:exodeoxyribonuclease VII small subunit [Oscillospiraceae bacterium]